MMCLKKFKKKKKREHLVREKKIRRRQGVQRQRKEEAKLDKLMQMNTPKREPYRKDDDPAVINERIERNLAVLKALEEQYNQETESRAKVNAELENSGCETIGQKFEVIRQRAEEITEAAKRKAKIKESGSKLLLDEAAD
jgi:hypothetical protein